METSLKKFLYYVYGRWVTFHSPTVAVLLCEYKHN